MHAERQRDRGLAGDVERRAEGNEATHVRADRGAVASHLAGCADCREVLARLAGLPGLLGNVPTADAIRLATEEADRIVIRPR